MVSSPPILQFLIPTYLRSDGALKAALSIASQIRYYSLEGKVSISITDDASPNFAESKFNHSLSSYTDVISFSSNPRNKGMSGNIYEMVSSSSGIFCTVLTDDDWLQPGVLLDILNHLEMLVEFPNIAGIFTPRYSYLEDGNLHCIACRPFTKNKILSAGTLNSLRYCFNGFILTGFIFRTSLMAKYEWMANYENAYFPVINFSSILRTHSLQFVDKNWFHHTVLNLCHWESWGDSEIKQMRRLYTDYIDAIAFLAHRCSQPHVPLFTSLGIFLVELKEYSRQIYLYSRTENSYLSYSSHLVRKRHAFRLSLLLSPLYILIFRLLSPLRSYFLFLF